MLTLQPCVIESTYNASPQRKKLSGYINKTQKLLQCHFSAFEVFKSRWLLVNNTLDAVCGATSLQKHLIYAFLCISAKSNHGIFKNNKAVLIMFSQDKKNSI